MKNTVNGNNVQEIDAVIAENRRRLEAKRLENEILEKECIVDESEDVSVRKRRCREDFVYWAACCVRIKDKMSGKMIPFRLNRPQRRVAAILEQQRKAGKPIRIIMLKARQWGGSTLVQMYMAWIQCTRLMHWHSLICAQVGKTSATIRGMYDTMLTSYPTELWEGDEAPRLTRFQSQELVREISGRHCCITLGSAENQDAVRGADYAMAHLSEVAFWKDTPKSTPADFIRAIYGAIALAPLTMVVLESTANGTGNYFHSEWMRSERGETDKVPVFVPWHEIDIYSAPVNDAAALWNSMDGYERDLWSQGLTLEQIAWYHHKRREYPTHSAMMSEYPGTAQEAFSNTGANVFAPEAVERLRQNCLAPIATGEIASKSGILTGVAALQNVGFHSDSTGGLKVWEHPWHNEQYVVSVDVGGRSLTSDWSVIAVFGTNPARIIAQWRGHTDHDLLTWKSAAIARHYNNALLVFESNTLESACYGMGDGESSPDQGEYILHTLYEHYPNLYFRQNAEGGTARPGFHTNRATKQMIITELIGAVRDGTFIERDHDACDELLHYCRRSNGSYGARSGFHDDILMSRAIGLHAISDARRCGASVWTDADLANFLGCRGGSQNAGVNRFCGNFQAICQAAPQP